MRHLIAGRKLGRTASHRNAMLGNLAMSIFEHERVVTTVQKAKEVRRVVERLITYAKRGTLGAIRLAARVVRDRELLRKLVHDIGPFYKDRQGGYTRILRTRTRPGDNAELCIIELVGRVAKQAPESGPGAAAGEKKPARPRKEPAEAAGEEESGAEEKAAKPARKAPRKSAKPAKEKEDAGDRKRGGKPGKGKKRGKDD